MDNVGPYLIRPLIVALALAFLTPLPGQATELNPYHHFWQCSPSKKSGWRCQEVATNKQNLYRRHLSESQHQEAVAEALGWIEDTSSSAHPSVCGGHYYDPFINHAQTQESLTEAPSTLSWDHLTYQLKGDMQLTGNVVISQPNRRLYADSATLTPQANSTQLKTVSASGNLRLEQPGMLLLGSQGFADLQSHKAHLNDVTYLVKVKPSWTNPGESGDKNFTGFAHGQAKSITQENQDLFLLTDTTYTTCPPTSNTWQLNASQITLDQKTGEGHAKNTILKIKDVPVFYLPYFTFPLTHDRKSGFLFGSLNHSSNSGFSASIPYYFNIAPNMDDTLTTTVFSRRGVLFENEFRYLTPSSTGDMDLNIAPYDALSHSSRAGINWHNTTQLSDHWSTDIDYRYISDPDFLNDFDANANVISANQLLLNRQATLTYSTPNASFTTLAQYYQVINDDLSEANRPYNRLPEADLDLNYPNAFSWGGLYVSSQFVNFQKSDLGEQTSVNGQRINLTPNLQAPIYKSYGFLIPSVKLNMSGYNLKNNTNNSTGDTLSSEADRILPSFSIDTGLFFDKAVTIDQQQYVGTLEPRLYYLYTPFTNQNNIPIFDTTLTNFNYFSLFNDNRFSGLDRISNANQLSVALQADIHDAYGIKKFEAGIGQAIYFTPQQVGLCSTNNPSCLENQFPDHSQAHSDWAAFAGYYFNPYWSISTDLTYNAYQNLFDMQSYQVQYRLDNRHLFNLGYQYIQHDFALLSNEDLLSGNVAAPQLSQITASGIWPLSDTWSVLGNWNYSINAHHTIDIFGGFEYSSCCWATRVIVQHYITNSDPNQPDIITGPTTTAFVVQFELKGLGSTSSDQIEDLKKQIPGYEPNN